MSAPKPSRSILNDPKHLLARLTRLESTIPGLDATLMLAQYSSPLIITLLLKLASIRARHPKVKFSQAAGQGILKVDRGYGLVQLAEGWGRAGGSIGDARVIMRAFGMLPVLQSLLALHPKPLTSLLTLLSPDGLAKALQSPKAISTLQCLAILAYYPLEHVSWLATKGIISMSPQKVGKATLWGVRFWALYVALKVYELQKTYLALSSRTRALQHSKPDVSPTEAEGFEVQDEKTGPKDIQGKVEEKVSQAKVLGKEWLTWRNATISNAGYAPLTIHWSTPGGIWGSPLITGTMGSVAAVGSLLAEWHKGDIEYE
ncbi:hypothetical protein L202_01782 [Cryptococcus amylolentus CBS 6039]|uniref:Uncharacterized protein n=1 Tax=Cryptococcus amylolentus CBS 6039 TaxID=1295533 RepID=A0A1E3I780_9TREE|nr:hypothetical protein L202_01782 [Cryptococcus amylolentus CBS 6039]ODN83686.1 hypothetical protein L202_01782 [Cryptococcus amylolentus CBS 6039]